MLFFSIIIPNYNHAAYLNQRIESVLNQTYQNFELIILDDASTDTSKTIIDRYRNYPQVTHIVYNEKNSGSLFKQWKKGIELAQGQWIWIAESDDYADEKFLEVAVTAIDSNAAVGIFYCDSVIAYNNAERKPARFSEKKNAFFKTTKWDLSYCKKGIDEINETLKFACTINNVSSVVFKKEIAEPFLPDLTNYTYHGDWHFYITLCFVTHIYYSNKCLNFYREHSDSHLNSTGFKVKKKTEHFQILKTLFYHPAISQKQKLITHYCAFFLSFGLLDDGWKVAYITIKEYCKIDRKLAFQVLKKMVKIKIRRKKYVAWFD